MQTPCVLLCRIDAECGLCLGCGRTLAEIGGWMQYDDAERQAIMARLPTRLAARQTVTARQALADTAG